MNHVDSILSAEKSDCYPDRLIFFTKYKNLQRIIKTTFGKACKISKTAVFVSKSALFKESEAGKGAVFFETFFYLQTMFLQ